MRLIDADALKTKAIKCETFKLTGASVFLKAVGTKEIDRAPTIDAVPVVRCKDCKYGEVDDADLPAQYLCNYHGADWNDENHFCSYGERRINNGICNTL